MCDRPLPGRQEVGSIPDDGVCLADFSLFAPVSRQLQLSLCQLVPSPSGANTRGRKGVWWAISTGKWVTTITKGRKQVHLEHFDRSADFKSNV